MSQPALLSPAPACGPNVPPPSRHPVYQTIAAHAASFSPGIWLAEHIRGVPTVHRTIGDGIEFTPVSAPLLRTAIMAARAVDGRRAFTDIKGVDHGHFALRLSMMATDGEGIREVQGMPMSAGSDYQYKDAAAMRDQGRIQATWDSAFAAAISSSFRIDLYRLHWALTPSLCKVHIDKEGFTLRMDTGELGLTPDLFSHTFYELLFEDKFKQMMPTAVQEVVERIRLSYPSSNNRYTWSGFSLGEALEGAGRIPGVGYVGRLPGFRQIGQFGSAVGNARIPLPGPLAGLKPGGLQLKNLPLPAVSVNLIDRPGLNIQMTLSNTGALGPTIAFSLATPW